MSTFRKILALLTPAQRRSSITLAALIVIGMLLETIGLGLVLPAIALFTSSNIGEIYPVMRPVLEFLGNPNQHELIVIGMFTVVAVYAIKALFLAYLAWRQNRFIYGVQGQLQQRLFTIYLRQPYAFHLQHNSAELIRNVVTEVAHYTTYALTPVLQLLSDGLILGGIAVLLLSIEPFGTLLVAIVLGTIAWAFHGSTRTRISRWGLERQIHELARLQHLQQGLGGAKDVKLLGREGDFVERFRLHAVASNRIGQRQATLQQLPRLWLELLAVAGLAALVLTIIARGRELSTVVPTLGLFGMAAFRLIPGMNRVLSSIQSLRYGKPALGLLEAELSLPAPALPPRAGAASWKFSDAIDLENITFEYSGAGSPSLRNVSLRIAKGEFVGFIGPSGSGKTTIVDVIMGLLAPTSGRVLADGSDIAGRLREWQDQIGYVAQSIYLTDDTLRRNVAFGLSDAEIDAAAVSHAIAAAQLEDFIATLPLGLETMVGERGVRLSGGQRQRIGIARALYHDPQVLVLDEATSALDTGIESGVMQSVAALHGSKTIIVVAHRLSTVEHCDRLCRFEEGRLVDTT